MNSALSALVPYGWWVTGGAYEFIFWVWAASTIIWLAVPILLGRIIRRINDGYLIGLCNIVWVFVGGGIGLYVLRGPDVMWPFAFGALGLPALPTLAWLRKAKTRKKKR